MTRTDEVLDVIGDLKGGNSDKKYKLDILNKSHHRCRHIFSIPDIYFNLDHYEQLKGSFEEGLAFAKYINKLSSAE
jgi:hypothetical protein